MSTQQPLLALLAERSFRHFDMWKLSIGCSFNLMQQVTSRQIPVWVVPCPIHCKSPPHIAVEGLTGFLGQFLRTGRLGRLSREEAAEIGTSRSGFRGPFG